MQRGKLAQEILLDVGPDGIGRREETQIERNPTADEVGLGPNHSRTNLDLDGESRGVANPKRR